jgi:hypothetical protein
MLLLVGWSLRRHMARDPVQRAWQGLSRKLGRVGLARQPWEGPLVYADRVAAARPRLAPQIDAIARDYAALRYGANAGEGRLAQLRQRIRKLKP